MMAFSNRSATAGAILNTQIERIIYCGDGGLSIYFLVYCLQYHLSCDNSYRIPFSGCCISFAGFPPFPALLMHGYVPRGQALSVKKCDHSRQDEYNGS